MTARTPPATDREARRTKLVCTIGPATRARIPELVAAGLDVARLNLSHGDPDDRRRNAATVRQAATAAGRAVAVLLDFPGPKIRLGPLRGYRATLETGARYRLRPGAPGAELPDGDEAAASTTYERLATDLQPGDRILLADGAVELRANRRDGDDLLTDVVRGGELRSRVGVNAPSERLSISVLTAADRAAVPLVAETGADLVAQSFVRTAADVDAFRALLPCGTPIIAKIETRAAVDDIDAILETADAIMVARGDLGVEIPFEEVPIVQKQLIRLALARGRPVIVATQMLESMINAPRPTRAEASDVANAVLDGADAVMLSAETAIGAFPIEAARAAIRVVTRADGLGAIDQALLATPRSGEETLVDAASDLARADDRIEAIACFTRTGRTAELLAARRPGVPVLAFSPDEQVLRRLAVRHALVPLPAPQPQDTDDLTALVADGAARSGQLATGATILILAAARRADPAPNLLRVATVGQ